MQFQQITIKDALLNIQERKWALPAIQRELVWSQTQIARLFDSLMRNYPIGSFLFWRVKSASVDKYQFYEFMDSYHAKENTHCKPLTVVNPETGLIAILDGQQRLTGLNIGLTGTHTIKLPRLWWSNPDAFPQRRLYLNLLAYADENEQGMEYDFRFLDPNQAKYCNDTHHWYHVGDILNTPEVGDIFLGSAGDNLPESKLAYGMLFKLHQVVHSNHAISYYEEKEQDIDKVLDIFIRTNSGGTILSYSDLLMSIAIATWGELDAREEINNLVYELNRIGDGFNFNKDFILKAGLMLADISSVAFKVTNFNRDNMIMLQKKWDDIAASLRYAIELIASFGYSRGNLSATNAVLPIAYYMNMRRLNRDFVNSHHYRSDRERIRQFLIRSLLKRGFWGSGVDSLLVALRSAIRKHGITKFPLEEIYSDMLRRGKSLVFQHEELEDLIENSHRSLSLLSLLYPFVQMEGIKYHIDHIFPKSKFTKVQLRREGIPEHDIQTFLDRVDCLPNLQLLNEKENMEKSDLMPREWLHKFYQGENERGAKIELHDLYETPENLSDFNRFYEARRERLLDRLRKILGVNPTSLEAE